MTDSAWQSDGSQQTRNLIITIQTNKCTQFHYNCNDIKKHQLLHVSNLSDPPSGSLNLPLILMSDKIVLPVGH